MKKIIFPFIALILLGGCNFFNDKKNNDSEEIIETMEIEIVETLNIKDITNNENFEKIILKSEKPSVVKFETKWCGACKTMKPIYESLANKYSDKINFATINVDNLPELADKYEIQGVPTFIFFKKGQPIEQIVGGISEEDFVNKIEQII